LLQAVKGITDLINVPGLINADFADLRTVMKEVGPAVMGSGSATGENRATEAARKAIDNQLLEDFGIDGARGLLINISASEESFTMAEFMEASALIQEKVDDDAKVVIGALYDDALGDELHVTVIATGVGGMADKKETINPVQDHMRRPSLPIKESETIVRGAPAAPNKQPRVTRLPGSNFDMLDNLGSSNIPEGKATNSINWNDDYLETPTYLRKKAN
jgi:cell division protein FtsZ